MNEAATRMQSLRTPAMVLTCMLALLVNNGFIIVGLTAFDPILIKTLSISVAALKGRDLVTLWSSGILALLVGYLADRFGARLLFAAGAVLLSLGMFAYAHVHSVAMLYAISLLLGLSQACSGVVVAVIALSQWTSRHRGLAIGIAISGTSLGNAAVPVLNGWLITTFGWRGAFLVLGVIPLLLVPLVLLTIRPRGGAASPIAAQPSTARPSSRAPAQSFGRVIFSAAFLRLGGAAGALVLSVLAVTTNVMLYARTLGLRPVETGQLLTAFFGSSLLAQLAGGYLADRLGPRRVLIVGLSCVALGALALAAPTTVPLPAAMAIMGIGWGIGVTSIELFASIVFAGPLFGRTLGALLMLETFAGGLGPIFAGWVFDRTGRFAPAFQAVALICLAAVISVAFLRRPGVMPEAPLAASSAAPR